MRIATLSLCATLAVTGFCSKASELELLKPVSNDILSELRGGFHLTNSYTIDIGISVITSVNGEHIYQSTIADLVIHNGVLSSSWQSNNNPLQDNGLLNIVQVGNGNTIGSEIGNSEQLTTMSNDVINSSIVSIIQNTLDDSVLGVSTIVDVDARASSILQDIRAKTRLEDALLNHQQ